MRPTEAATSRPTRAGKCDAMRCDAIPPPTRRADRPYTNALLHCTVESARLTLFAVAPIRLTAAYVRQRSIPVLPQTVRILVASTNRPAGPALFFSYAQILLVADGLRNGGRLPRAPERSVCTVRLSQALRRAVTSDRSTLLTHSLTHRSRCRCHGWLAAAALTHAWLACVQRSSRTRYRRRSLCAAGCTCCRQCSRKC